MNIIETISFYFNEFQRTGNNNNLNHIDDLLEKEVEKYALSKIRFISANSTHNLFMFQYDLESGIENVQVYPSFQGVMVISKSSVTKNTFAQFLANKV